MKGLNVIVVGGGIGGLQAALALGHDGHKVTVLESVEKFLEVIPCHASIVSSFSKTKPCIGRCRHPCPSQFVALEC